MAHQKRVANDAYARLLLDAICAQMYEVVAEPCTGCPCRQTSRATARLASRAPLGTAMGQAQAQVQARAQAQAQAMVDQVIPTNCTLMVLALSMSGAPAAASWPSTAAPASRPARLCMSA